MEYEFGEQQNLLLVIESELALPEAAQRGTYDEPLVPLDLQLVVFFVLFLPPLELGPALLGQSVGHFLYRFVLLLADAHVAELLDQERDEGADDGTEGRVGVHPHIYVPFQKSFDRFEVLFGFLLVAPDLARTLQEYLFLYLVALVVAIGSDPPLQQIGAKCYNLRLLGRPRGEQAQKLLDLHIFRLKILIRIDLVLPF